MTTPISPITSAARLARVAWQARGLAVPLLAAGALAAGCATPAANPGGLNEPVAASGTAPAGSHPASSAKPVPTVTGGPMIPAGGDACSGWPASAAHGTLTAFFTPVAVERCVTGFQQIAGKGEWETATLERSTDKLATLTAVLLHPSASHQPEVFCPDFAIIPPQIVLIDGTGKELIPRLPVGSCGTVEASLLSTLATMTWQPLSVTLVTKITPAAVPTPPNGTFQAGSPRAIQTGGATGVENGQPVSSAQQ
jgi:hypothetical protein